jgi:hypothetical protein
VKLLGQKAISVNEFPSFFIDDALFPAQSHDYAWILVWTGPKDNWPIDDLDHYSSEKDYFRSDAGVQQDLTALDASN